MSQAVKATLTISPVEADEVNMLLNSSLFTYVAFMKHSFGVVLQNKSSSPSPLSSVLGAHQILRKKIDLISC